MLEIGRLFAAISKSLDTYYFSRIGKESDYEFNEYSPLEKMQNLSLMLEIKDNFHYLFLHFPEISEIELNNIEPSRLEEVTGDMNYIFNGEKITWSVMD